MEYSRYIPHEGWWNSSHMTMDCFISMLVLLTAMPSYSSLMELVMKPMILTQSPPKERRLIIQKPMKDLPNVKFIAFFPCSLPPGDYKTPGYGS